MFPHPAVMNKVRKPAIQHMHVTILHMSYHVNPHCCAVPPVHLIASQIASLYNLNLDKIKRRLIEVIDRPFTLSLSYRMTIKCSVDLFLLY